VLDPDDESTRAGRFPHRLPTRIAAHVFSGRRAGRKHSFVRTPDREGRV